MSTFQVHAKHVTAMDAQTESHHPYATDRESDLHKTSGVPCCFDSVELARLGSCKTDSSSPSPLRERAEGKQPAVPVGHLPVLDLPEVESAYLRGRILVSCHMPEPFSPWIQQFWKTRRGKQFSYQNFGLFAIVSFVKLCK